MIGDKEKHALITGASSGIGYELAKLFARDGKKMVIIARNKEKLEKAKTGIEKVCQEKVITLSKDLSNPVSPQEIYDELNDAGIEVDVLVNNAGYGVLGKFSETDLDKELGLIQVFTGSLTHLTKLFLKPMIEWKSGNIVTVSSGLGMIPIPFFAIYSACEAYVLHFSEALANELKRTGVKVTCLLPSPTNTGFAQSANAGNKKIYNPRLLMDSTAVAKVGYQAIKQGKITTTIGLLNLSTIIMNKILPRRTATNLMRFYTEWGLQDAK
jgi:short-subunit dehydrogenase